MSSPVVNRPEGRPRSPWPLGAIAAAAGGLVAALAASMPAPTRPQEGAAPGLLPLPEALTSVVVVLLSVTALLVLALLVPRGARRRRRKGGEELELCHDPPGVPAWLQWTIWLVALAPLVALLLVVWSGGASLDLLWTSGSREAGPAAPAPPPVGRDARPPAPPTPMPIPGALLASLVVLASLGVLGLVLWVWAGERLAWWWVGPLPEIGTEPLAVATDDSLRDLRREADPRRAIIRCYRHFERTLGAARVPREPWQTPTEFMREVLGRRALPPAAVARLTRLFEIARFSERRLVEDDREAAWEALTAIRAALQEDAGHGPSR